MLKLSNRITLIISLLLILTNFISCRKDGLKEQVIIISTDKNYVFKPNLSVSNNNHNKASTSSGTAEELCDGTIYMRFGYINVLGLDTEDFRRNFLIELNAILRLNEKGYAEATTDAVFYTNGDGYLYERMKNYIIQAFKNALTSTGYGINDGTAPYLQVEGIYILSTGKTCHVVYIEDPQTLPPNTIPDVPGIEVGVGTFGARPASIYDEIKDPCVKSILLNTLRFDMKGEIQSILKNLGQDSKVKLTVIDEPDIAGNKDGETSGYFTTQDGVTVFTGTIHLNMDHLTNASQEYISGIIIHEAIHGYFRAMTGTDETVNALDHVTMSQDYIYPMALFLSQMYGIDLADAAAIEWRGVTETPAYKNADSFTMGYGTNQITVNKIDIEQAGVAYYINSKGTPRCN